MTKEELKKIKRHLKIYFCFIGGGHVWLWGDGGCCNKCGLGWDERHPTDWRWF